MKQGRSPTFIAKTGQSDFQFSFCEQEFWNMHPYIKGKCPKIVACLKLNFIGTIQWYPKDRLWPARLDLGCLCYRDWFSGLNWNLCQFACHLWILEESRMSKDPLLQPFQLNHLTLRNRIMTTSHEHAYYEDVQSFSWWRARNAAISAAPGAWPVNTST